MKMAYDQELGSEGLASATATLVINTQKQTVQGIMQSDAYQNLVVKADPDVREFVATMQALNQNLGSTEYREQMERGIRDKADSGPFSFETLRGQSPLIDSIAKYLWLINAFAAASFFLTVSNLLLANIAGAYAMVFRKIIDVLNKAH